MEQDPYRYFRIEARELTEELARGVLDLEKGTGGMPAVTRLFRAAHTLKGAARVVKQREIADLAHEFEDVLGPHRDGGPAPTREQIDRMLELTDRMSTLVAALAIAPAPQADAPARVAAPAVEEAFRSLRADVADMDALLDDVAETQKQLGVLRNGVALVERGRRLADSLFEQLGAPRARDARGASSVLEANRTRVLADELRALLSNADRNLTLAMEQAERELNQVRAAAEGLRLLPASTLFNSLERAVRDAAQALGKQVVFEVRGADVRLDSHVLSVVQTAMVQLARNAVAHGIESARERSALGKPASGTIRFEIVRRGDRVTFRCRDDGRGIDLAAVWGAVQRAGGVRRDQRMPPHEELLQMLLRGGISTAADVTALSGRGIGLNVVREAADRLGGSAAIQTEPGRGTSVELTAPASVAAIEGLLVAAGVVKAVIPLDAVLATLRLGSRELVHAAHGATVLFEGEAVPFLPLSRALGRPAAAVEDKVWSIAVVHAAGVRVAFGTDRLLGATRVVLRPLPRLAPAAAVIAGTAFDSEGQPQLVLDVERLVASALAMGPLPDAEHRPRATVLVIDDSLTTRMLEQSILESAGYEVELASSAEEGMEKARARRYALFLVDVEMPGIDGFTFVERTRADAVLRETPAILVTSRNAPEDRRRGEQVGASAYIVKSEFDQAELLDRIRTLVS